METLITTLITALLTGLTILAYRHPNGYQKIYSWFSVLFLAVVIGGNAWNAGVAMGFSKIVSYIQAERLDLAAKTNDALMIPQIYLWMMLLAFFYFFGLNFLHLIVKKEEQDTVKKQS